MKRLFYILILLMTTHWSCTTSKYYARQGKKLQKAGMEEQAAEYYLQAVQKKYNNVDARIGLQNTGQHLLDQYLGEFYKAHALESHKKAVYSFLDAQEFHQKVMDLNIKLDLPEHYIGYYNESKNHYLDEKYAEGRELLAEGQFNPANSLFNEIHRIDPSYKEVMKLKMVSKIEPWYRAGKEHYENNRFRAAYKEFSKVVRENPDYADAKQFKSTCLDEAQLTLTIIPFDSNTFYKNSEDRLSAYVQTGLINSGNEFIKVVDRSNVDRIIQEQRFGLNGLVDESSAAEAGKLLGVKTVLMSKVSHVHSSTGQLSRQRRTGYEKSVRYIRNPDGTRKAIVSFRKVTYYEYVQQSKAALSYQYQLVSSETGEILKSRIVERTDNDNVHYAVYNGDYKKLYPRPTEVGVFSEKAALDRLFRARKEIKAGPVMQQQLVESISDQVVNDILEYENTRS